jgi:hypothetical protein
VRSDRWHSSSLLGNISLAVKLFPKRGGPAKPVAQPVSNPLVPADPNRTEAAAPAAIIEEKFPAISMSADLKGMLDQPLDPRVDRILQNISDDKIAEERSVKARQVIRFPRNEKQEPESDAETPIADRL